MNKKTIIIIAIIVIIIAAIGAFTLLGNSSSDDTINIGYMPSDHHAALFIANSTGQFEEKGIKVNLVQFNNGGDIMTAAASGDIDIAYVGITPALSSIAKGVPIKVVSSVQSEGSGIVASKGSGISSIADLKGKSVATPGEASIQYMLLLYALEKEGLTKDDVSISAMKVVSMVDALRTNNIDAIVSYEPFVTIPLSEGIGTEIASSAEILPDHPCCVIVARDDFINNKGDTLKEILKIHENATNFVLENPEKTVELLPADIVPDAEAEKEALKNVKFSSGLDDAFINKVLDFMNIEIDMGLLKEALTKDQIFKVI
ncbi:MAG: ABC transporter substrate-binding protein [Methanobrevibacter sp.]|jgi:NitT/TauT family transport system substrate-binding protein|nr:ABC transporter substrate-binding protein [Methanobrevibacter sp.]